MIKEKKRGGTNKETRQGISLKSDTGLNVPSVQAVRELRVVFTCVWQPHLNLQRDPLRYAALNPLIVAFRRRSSTPPPHRIQWQMSTLSQI